MQLMKYRYVAVYQIRGLIHNPDMYDVEITVKANDSTIRVILTANPDNYCYDLDREQSIRILTAKFMRGQKGESDLADQVATEITRIHERRKKELEDSEVLVFIAEGEIQANFSKNFIEKDRRNN
jgi:hypothetical protein